jgi:hypothetical protein
MYFEMGINEHEAKRKRSFPCLGQMAMNPNPKIGRIGSAVAKNLLTCTHAIRF